jgi:RecA-family ATPase
LVVTDLHTFLAEPIAPCELILAPIIMTQSLSMIHAWRGVGKTHVALGIAYAVASGGEFLRWKAPVPRKVLYLDG